MKVLQIHGGQIKLHAPHNLENVLFIVMNAKFYLTEDLLKKIKIQIKKNASPRHVPSKVIVINDIPRTKSGKIVELAVKNTIEGNRIKNKEIDQLHQLEKSLIINI